MQVFKAAQRSGGVVDVGEGVAAQFLHAFANFNDSQFRPGTDIEGTKRNSGKAAADIQLVQFDASADNL